MSFAQTPLLPGVSRRGALAQRRWLQRAALVSVLLHLLPAAYFLYRPAPSVPEAPAESLPSVELVLEEAAARAAPTPGAPPLPAPSTILAEPPAPPPSPEAPSPPAPAQSPPPSPDSATAPPAPPPSPPAPNATAAPAEPPPAAAPPAIAAPRPAETPPVVATPLPLPGPPPPAAPPEPQPRLATPAPPRPATPPAARPQRTPQDTPRPAARPQPPAPPAFAGTRFIPDATLGPLRPPQPAQAPRRTAPEQLALGPNARPDLPNAAPAMRSDENVAGATMRITGANLGADWRAAFMEWLRRNGRFPREAAMNGEDGTNIVRFEVDRQGRVQSVRLITRSGSQWLDIASTALLRDRTIPPFPPGTESNAATIDLTINYILVRR